MKKYKWLMWKHGRAMAIFEAVKRSLEKLILSFQEEMKNSLSTIESLRESIDEEHKNINFINDQLTLTKKRVEKIDSIINPE